MQDLGQKLFNFVVFMSQQGLKYQVMKCYLLAVCHLQVACGNGRNPRIKNMPWLELALAETRKEQSGNSKQARLPITPARGALKNMFQVCNWEPTSWNHWMLWAVCCVGFFSFQHSVERTALGKEDFNASQPTNLQHLFFKDTAVDNTSVPKVVSVRTKQSKTDPFQQEVAIFLSRTDTPICMVVASSWVFWLCEEWEQAHPLFHSQDGQPLTDSCLVMKVRQALQKASNHESTRMLSMACVLEQQQLQRLSRHLETEIARHTNYM